MKVTVPNSRGRTSVEVDSEIQFTRIKREQPISRSSAIVKTKETEDFVSTEDLTFERVKEADEVTFIDPLTGG